MSTDGKLNGAALTQALMFELSKSIAKLEHTNTAMLTELTAIRRIFEADDDASSGVPASSAPATTTTATAPASGMEKLVESMLAAELGVDPETLRSGKIDDAVMQKMVAEAIAKKKAAATNGAAST